MWVEIQGHLINLDCCTFIMKMRNQDSDSGIRVFYITDPLDYFDFEFKTEKERDEVFDSIRKKIGFEV